MLAIWARPTRVRLIASGVAICFCQPSFSSPNCFKQKPVAFEWYERERAKAGLSGSLHEGGRLSLAAFPGGRGRAPTWRRGMEMAEKLEEAWKRPLNRTARSKCRTRSPAQLAGLGRFVAEIIPPPIPPMVPQAAADVNPREEKV